MFKKNSQISYSLYPELLEPLFLQITTHEETQRLFFGVHLLV